MKIRKNVYTCITCFIILCINKSLLSCTKEIVPGLGLESDCFIGMSLETLKGRIHAKDDRSNVWYIDDGSIGVLHDKSKVTEIFFYVKLDEMVNNPFDHRRCFVGTIKGLKDCVSEIKSDKVESQWGKLPLAKNWKYRFMQQYGLSSKVKWQTPRNSECSTFFLAYHNRGIRLYFSGFDGRVNMVDVFSNQVAVDRATKHGVLPIKEVQAHLSVDFDNLDLKEETCHYVILRNDVADKITFTLPRKIEDENVDAFFSLDDLDDLDRGESTYILLVAKKNGAHAHAGRFSIPFSYTIDSHQYAGSISYKIEDIITMQSDAQ